MMSPSQRREKHEAEDEGDKHAVNNPSFSDVSNHSDGSSYFNEVDQDAPEAFRAEAGLSSPLFPLRLSAVPIGATSWINVGYRTT